MTIESRLAKLEGTAPQTAVSEFAEQLASLLGEVDSIFWPRRTTKDLVHFVQIRRQYLTTGIPWTGSSTGGSSRAWKSDQRLRTAMAASGLIKLTRSKSNLPMVQLAFDAEQQVRSMVALPAMEKLWACLMLVRLKSPDHGNTRTGGWVCETDLFASTYADKPTTTDWDQLTRRMLPLMVAGCVESKPSTIGHVFYRVTGKPLPEALEVDRDIKNKADFKLAGSYDDAFFSGLERTGFEPTSELSIPLSATV